MINDDENPMLLKKKKPLTPAQELANKVGLSKTNPLEEIWKFGNRPISPFFRVRDLNNPAGDNGGRTSRPAVEAGIKITF